eukprot:1161708-Pelagomonas_calceolata.AAC.3
MASKKGNAAHANAVCNMQVQNAAQRRMRHVHPGAMKQHINILRDGQGDSWPFTDAYCIRRSPPMP